MLRGKTRGIHCAVGHSGDRNDSERVDLLALVPARRYPLPHIISWNKLTHIFTNSELVLTLCSGVELVPTLVLKSQANNIVQIVS